MLELRHAAFLRHKHLAQNRQYLISNLTHLKYASTRHNTAKAIFYPALLIPLLSTAVAVAETPRVYRPDVTNQHIQPAPTITHVTFTVTPDLVRDLRVIDRKIHITLTKEGREQFYFTTAGHVGKKLTVSGPSGEVIVSGPIRGAVESGYLISSPFATKTAAVTLARALRPRKNATPEE